MKNSHQRPNDKPPPSDPAAAAAEDPRHSETKDKTCSQQNVESCSVMTLPACIKVTYTSQHLAEMISHGYKMNGRGKRRMSSARPLSPAVCLKAPKIKPPQTNKMPLNDTDGECPRKDPGTPSIPSRQSYCTAGDGVTGGDKMSASTP